jgi:two-component system, chemotaxis family, CheB/CheR fusion protein
LTRKQSAGGDSSATKGKPVQTRALAILKRKTRGRKAIHEQSTRKDAVNAGAVEKRDWGQAKAGRRTDRKSDLPVGNKSFPVVGIGASAGGLEAFTQLLKHLPLDTGMGFVLVQHLDPVHESALTQLLSRATLMPVREVKNNTRVEPDHVYVIPPNTSMAIASGVLKLQPRQRTRTPTRSIDSFLESLAQDQREKAIGVILSGTATDGTLGLEAIKAEGGITFAQDDSAKYDSMPRSAAGAGCVDFVLAPENIAKELSRISKHPYVAGHALHSEVEREADQHGGAKAPLASGGHGTPRTGSAQARAEAKAAPDAEDNGYKKILLLLRNHCGVDFSLYKSTTIQRRITRRMVLNKHTTLDEYAHFLRGNSKELDALYSDALISVTSFFRNPEGFEYLKRKVFPKLLQQRGDDPFRVWVLGCSTGQEAYSLAMTFMEAAEKAPRLRKLQVFATDLNEALLEKARHGLYTQSLAEDVSPERLRRFFVEEEGGYRIVKSLREMVVFARQNLISDPPFSRMDLISCRNLLIYLEPSLQKKALPTFHYALKPGGFLFLGASESIGGFTDLFEPADRKHKIYSKKAAPTPAFHLPVKRERGEQPLLGKQARPPTPIERSQEEAPEAFRAELTAQREADRVTVNQFGPPGVLVNAELQIVQFRGPTGGYLEPPPGKASFDVLKMAREGLMLPLRAAINKAKKENKAARKENVRLQQNGQTRTVNVEVIPLKNLRESCFLILFEDAEMVAPALSGESSREMRTPLRTSKREESRRVAGLERELVETRDYLQSLQEQHEAANEELQASNEEVQSANEELQSINEELETSKEELESTNEELTTVNEEMANRNTELNRLNSDLVNLQTSTKLAIVLLARDLTIRRFSAQAERQFNLLAADVGRPIGNVRHNLELSDLEDLIAEVIADVRESEREVRDKDGRWYSLRVRPYLTIDNKVDGAVLVLVNIDALKQNEQAIAAARDYAEAVIETVREPLIVLDENLRVRTANRSFYEDFQVKPEETENRFLFDLGKRQWGNPKLRTLLEEILPQKSQFHDFEVEQEFEHIGRRTMLLNARRLAQDGNGGQLILLAIEDITERKQGDDARRESEERYRTLFDLGPVAVYSCDASGVIQNFNRRAAELWDREPASGDTDERFCGSFKLFRPDGSFMPHEQCPMAEVIAGKVPAARDAEVLIERPDGSRVTVIVNIRPLKNERGEITGAINCFYDITERKRNEEALHEAGERFRFMAESMPQKMFTAKSNGDVDYFNQQWTEFTGLSFEQIRDWGWTQFIHPDDLEENVRVWQHSVDTGEEFQFEHRFRHADGEYRWHLSRALAMRDSQERVLMWIGSNTDIDDVKRAEEERERLLASEQQARREADEANRMKDEFLATVSHELRTPLNAILGWAEILKRGGLEEQTAAHGVEIIARNARAQNQLISDLLDVSRIISGQFRFESGVVDLISVIESATDTVRPAADVKGVELRLTLDPAAGMVSGDAARFQQVVWNLLTNAVKFTSRNGSVEVRLKREGTSVAMIIRDTGEGISPEFLPYIFDRFRQAQGTTARQQGGLGLGLAIVRHLVEAHGGTVRAASKGIGKGATFTVTLPLIAVSRVGSDVEYADAGNRSADDRASLILKGVRVLVVDDEPDARELLTIALTQSGAGVKAAATVSAALDMLDEWEPEVLVSDIGMPSEDGYELIRKVRTRDPEHGGLVPALALTGYAGSEDAARAVAAGYQTHMAKPVVLSELVAAVASLARKVRRR